MTISKDLFLSVLALDSYNRGYHSGIAVSFDTAVGLGDTPDISRIGSATVSYTIADAGISTAAFDTGFYAIAYKMGGAENGAGVDGLTSGTTIISYRGTDLGENAGGNDIWRGWAIGAGYTGPGTQAGLAFDFYTKATGHAVKDGRLSDVILTGHSLGGGLAGLVGSTTGNDAVVFDYMPFTVAAELGYLLAPQNEKPASSPAYSQVIAINVLGEVLSPIRVAGPAIEVGAATLLHPLIGAALAYEVIKAEAAISDDQLNSEGGVRSLFDLHSQSLLTALLFARDNNHTGWISVGDELWDAAFDESVALKAGFEAAGVKGSATPQEKMLSAIAYSALDEGERPFGDVAIHSMFNDADRLGGVSGVLTSETKTALARLLVQFAGEMALADREWQNDQLGPTEYRKAFGILSSSSLNSGVLGVDLSKALWGLGSSNSQPGGDDADAVRSAAGLDLLSADVLAAMTLAGVSKSDVQRFYLPVSTGPEYQLSEPILKFIGGPTDDYSWGLFVSPASTSDQTIHGTSVSDLIVAGAGDARHELYGHDGNDILVGGNGSDHLYGGLGKDILFGGTGHDFLNGEDDDDTLFGGAGDDFLDGGSGFDTLRYSGSFNQYNIERIDLGHGNITGNLTTDAGSDHVFNIEVVDFTNGSYLWNLAGFYAIQADHMGTENSDILRGGSANERFHGLGGNDIIFASDGNDILYGNKGNDILYGERGSDVIFGGAGDDFLYDVYGPATTIYSDAGNDRITIYSFFNSSTFINSGIIDGGEGDDIFEVALGSKYEHDRPGLYGSRFYSDGYSLDNFIMSGIETLITWGSAVAGKVAQFASLSHIVASDSWAEAGRTFTINLSLSNAGTIDLSSQLADQSASIGASTFGNTIIAGRGDDDLWGREGSDNLHGGAGADTLSGYSGDDVLVGGAGDDTIYGDHLGSFADSGKDTAVFSGNFADYQITPTSIPDQFWLNNVSAWSVADKVLGRDGTDKVYDVDYLQFADTIVAVSSPGEMPINIAPFNVRLSRTAVAEDTPQWTTVGLLSAADFEGDTISFKMIDGSDDHFRIKGNRLVTSKAFDYETQSSHHITVEVSDGTNKVLKDFEISVADVYEPLVNLAPKNLSFSRSSIKENVAVGTSVGLLNAMDPEGGTLKWHLTDDAHGTFKLVGNKLMTTSEIDYEATHSLTIGVEVIDNVGNVASEDFVIAVQNLRESSDLFL
ncbi:hypothetical protein [Rhizobium leguminosarum]|uniref:hypothetical protein n=1 Tax=Rhizobium leguminosarum TaxID=384 RepID=UPI003F9BCA94